MAEYIVDVSKIEHVPRISKEAAYAMLFSECSVPLYERIVRCKGCKWNHESYDPKKGFCILNQRFVEDNGFCAWGKPKAVE